MVEVLQCGDPRAGFITSGQVAGYWWVTESAGLLVSLNQSRTVSCKAKALDFIGSNLLPLVGGG